MMKEEFEKIAGYEVSYEDYNKIIEPMYMATNLSKEDFVQCVNKKRFALTPLNKMVKDMHEIAYDLMLTCVHYTDYEAYQKLNELVEEYIGRKYIMSCGYMYNYGYRQTCRYPVSVEIYGTKTYKTVERIEIL